MARAGEDYARMVKAIDLEQIVVELTGGAPVVPVPGETRAAAYAELARRRAGQPRPPSGRTWGLVEAYLRDRFP